LLFGIPIADTFLAMLRRFIEGLRGNAYGSLGLLGRFKAAASMMQADRSHIHHKLLELGLSHVKVVLVMYGCGVALAGAALLSVVARYELQGYILITVGLATYIGLRKLGYHEVFAPSKGHFPAQVSPSLNRMFFIGFVDLTIICVAYWAAVLLKYDIIWGTNVRAYFSGAFPKIIPIQLGVLFVSGLYRGLWRTTGVGDLWRIACASTTAIVLSCGGTLWWMGYYPGLITFFVIDLSMLFLSIAMCRTAPRLYQNWRLKAAEKKEEKAVIYGAGRGGQLALWELTNNQKYKLRPVAFIDDNPDLVGRTVNLVPIIGTLENLESYISLQDISAVVISSKKITENRLSVTAEICGRTNVTIWNAHLTFNKIGLGASSDENQNIALDKGEEMSWIKKQKSKNVAIVASTKSRI
jgi:UDP-GlcNAc:undecaprenyl-phosphate/decaprenyl-phosphate GlcNAc-1-phosphate transferase